MELAVHITYSTMFTGQGKDNSKRFDGETAENF